MAQRREGEIVPRGPGRYMIRWPVDRDEKTGRPRAKSKTIRGARRDAERELRKVLRSRDTGDYVEPSKTTLNTYLDDWLESAARPKVATRTYEDYRYMLKHYVRPILGAQRLDSLRPLDVQGLIGQLVKQGLSPRTVRIAHGILKVP